ncbi:Na+/H+ antiporter [uncultured Azohydromonas sp.]|uniref:Na+/H+ antiporter n=1 Tax=uncultured Azohydromonas sp. TaxID=487342 RepID=UPI002616CFB1|nr:Na+/H+ antiporter [uncultured Azohydromonas sp.]
MGAVTTMLFMLLAVAASSFAARATGWPAPLVQIALGAAVGFSPLPSVVLDPEVFFLLFLPPLLFLDGWRIPKDELFRDAATVLRLALGLVLFTVLGMGLFIHWLVPAMPLPVAFALAAVISPTDPIAVSSVASRTPIPKRVMHVLEGEALLNDASGLVCMRFAVAAALTGAFSLPQALLSFLWLGLGGAAIGTALAWLVSSAQRWSIGRFGDAGGNEILVTLLLPFGAYLLAEHAHCSGVLAAAAAGITMSFTGDEHWHGRNRIQRTAVWDTVQAMANGSIFVLLGEQLPAIVSAAGESVTSAEHQSPAWLAVYVVAIVAGLAALRFAWVWVSLRTQAWHAQRRGEPGPMVNWRLVMVVSLAGVRGAVTLAGVLTLPLALSDGTPFPARDLAISLAAGVILLSLLVATFSLPHLLRGLQLPAEPSERVAEDEVRRVAAQAAIRALESARQDMAAGVPDPSLCTEAAARLEMTYRLRIDKLASAPDDAEALASADRIERQLRLVALRAERDAIIRHGRELGLAELAQQRLLREIDLVEARYGA